MRHFMPALRMLIFMTILTGVIYPLVVTGISQALFPRQTEGQLLTNESGAVVGSALIAQKFTQDKYFWPRPSAVDFNPMPSGGSNLSQDSADLKKAFEDRKLALQKANPSEPALPPQDLLFASGSGLDPHISPEAAQYQLQRVAKSRGMNVEQVQKIVTEMTEDRQYRVFGEPTVNVLALNLALDKEQKGTTK